MIAFPNTHTARTWAAAAGPASLPLLSAAAIAAPSFAAAIPLLRTRLKIFSESAMPTLEGKRATPGPATTAKTAATFSPTAPPHASLPRQVAGMQWALLLDGNELLVRTNIYPAHHEHYGDACALVFNLLLQPMQNPIKSTAKSPKTIEHSHATPRARSWRLV